MFEEIESLVGETDGLQIGTIDHLPDPKPPVRHITTIEELPILAHFIVLFFSCQSVLQPQVVLWTIEALQKIQSLPSNQADNHWNTGTVVRWFRNNKRHYLPDSSKASVHANPASSSNVEPPRLPRAKGKKMYFRVSPFTHSHVRRTEVILGESRDRIDLIAFLLNLPFDWKGTYSESIAAGPTGSGPFRHRLTISDPDNAPTFHLFWNADFTSYAIYATAEAHSICCRRFSYLPDDDAFRLPIRQNAMDEVRHLTHHPYTAIGHKLFGVILQEETDEHLTTVWDQKVLSAIEIRIQRDKNSRDIRRAIDNLRGDSAVSIKYSSMQSAKQLRLHKGEYLYHMIWIFPQAVALLKSNPNCVMLDGTFKILKPYTLEILHVVISNEAIPIAFCITPTETKESYSDLYQAVIDALKRNGERAELLTELPLVSDQGSALIALVTERHLTWRLCHRHLIENAGASSLIGSWIARLLRCCSFAEYQRTRDVIKAEVKFHYPKGGFPTGYEKLQRMLNPPSQPRTGQALSRLDFIFQLQHWARWLRLGCPTTSNAAESIHARLNALKKPHQLLFTRIAVVVNYCQDRYAWRNHPERVARRASNRFLKVKKTHPESFRDPGRLDFYNRLNSPPGVNTAVKNWVFPDYDLTAIQLPRTVESQKVDVQLPDSWKSNGPAKSETDDETGDNFSHADPIDRLLGDCGIEDNEPPGVDNLIHTIAWDVIFSIRRQLPVAWEHKSGTIIPVTFTIGKNLEHQGVDVTSVPGEAKWRFDVYCATKLLLSQAPEAQAPEAQAPEAQAPEAQGPIPQALVRMSRPPDFVPWK
jgi:hypothetical protein